VQKSELISWLQDQIRQWHAFLDEFGRDRLEQPGVTGPWSMKDVAAHMTGWNRRLVAYLEAAKRGLPHPPPPWPADLKEDDEINAWIYESNRDRPLQEILDETDQVLQQVVASIEGLPDDIRIETVVGGSGREYYLVWIGDTRYPAGEFFDHFHDDHEPDLRAWMAAHPRR
jgi:hypothetical protein